jgi:hypothetical protein
MVDSSKQRQRSINVRQMTSRSVLHSSKSVCIQPRSASREHDGCVPPNFPLQTWHFMAAGAVLVPMLPLLTETARKHRGDCIVLQKPCNSHQKYVCGFTETHWDKVL